MILCMDVWMQELGLKGRFYPLKPCLSYSRGHYRNTKGICDRNLYMDQIYLMRLREAAKKLFFNSRTSLRGRDEGVKGQPLINNIFFKIFFANKTSDGH